VGKDGESMSRAEAHRLAIDHSLPMVDIAELANAYRNWSAFTHRGSGSSSTTTARVSRRQSATMPTQHGEFTAIGYLDCTTGSEHVAMVSAVESDDEVNVRIHSQCMTSESLGSLRCDCAEQLDVSLSLTAQRGGVVIYLAGHEGRGIGLTAKLAAYRLQDEKGLDTVDANVALNVPVDSREYGAAVAILRDLGIKRCRLLTGNPAKVAGLRNAGIDVAHIEPLIVAPTVSNRRYLHAKRFRLGHVG